MAGLLEPLRHILSREPLRRLRDLFIQLAWRLDPELTALQWTLLDLCLTDNRKRQFLSWNRYDKLYRNLATHLMTDPEWRQGPEKSWDIALGAIKAMGLANYSNSSNPTILDFGCGSHFPESTGLLLYLYGAIHVDSVELEMPKSGFKTGAALDLVHWLKDQLILQNSCLIQPNLQIQPVRLDELHKYALKRHTDDYCFFPAVNLMSGNIFDSRWDEKQYDIITSNAVMEHVDDPERMTYRLFSLLKEGGIMHHVIDFRDHRAYYHPERYKPLPAVKNRKEWADPHTNGWRFAEWYSLCKTIPGSEIIECKTYLYDSTETQINLEYSAPIASCEIFVQKKREEPQS